MFYRPRSRLLVRILRLAIQAEIYARNVNLRERFTSDCHSVEFGATSATGTRAVAKSCILELQYGDLKASTRGCNAEI
jgi:hypothetical protein